MTRPKTDMEFYSIVGPVYGAGPLPDLPDYSINEERDAYDADDDLPEDEVQYEDCQGFQGGCGSPSCLSCNPPEPCCYASFRTRGEHHDYDCEEYDR